MREAVLVTGCAGFIGSHLCERLLSEGFAVLGVDCFTDYYSPSLKKENLQSLLKHPHFEFWNLDLVSADLKPLIQRVGAVFHQAGQPGVRASWRESFQVYLANNVLATQRLLEACIGAPLHRFVFASSSSVYGDADRYPTSEETLPQPVSPYGATKLAAEHLCRLYWKNFGVPTISLRYFTVYGPRQRPDMAFHKFIRALFQEQTIEIYGDGQQTRDFTYVSDIVEANLLALRSGYVGEVFNIGGGSRISLEEVLNLLEEITGCSSQRVYQPSQKGDVLHTGADITKARRMLGYKPRVSLREGLQAEVEWLRTLELE